MELTHSYIYGIIVIEVMYLEKTAKKDGKKALSGPIVNNLNDSYIVTKSRPIMLMRDVPFVLGELKVLDTYLSRINPKEPSATTVRFTKEEYEDLMGIERMHAKRLNKYVTSLQAKVVTVPDKTAKKGWRNYSLFDESSFEQDDNGQWWIDLSCTPKAKKLFFNVKGVGYIRYQLKNVLPLVSKHSVFLYIYLLDNRFRASWSVSLQELREKWLHCNSEFYAANYRNFKQDILDKALAEVNEKTDLGFKYTTIKTGRKVTSIKFTLVRDETDVPELPDADEEQFTLFDEPSYDDASDPVLMFADALPDSLTYEQVKELAGYAYDHVPYDPRNPLPRDNRVADYLRRKTLQMNSYSSTKEKVKSPYNWLKKAIMQNWE